MATKRFITPFADTGVKAPISDVPAGTDVNYETGYTPEYALDPVSDPNARFVEITNENQLLNDITGNIKLWQDDNYPEFITTANNGGVAHSYNKNVVVRYDGDLYISTEDGNATLPTSSKWIPYLPSEIAKYLELKIFQSPTDGLTEINTRTLPGGEVYEVRKVSDDSLATIYSDKDGDNEIVQNGTSNVSDSVGVVEFYIADGDYYVEVSSVRSDFTAGKLDKVSSVSKLSNYSKATIETLSYHEGINQGGAVYEYGEGVHDGCEFIDPTRDFPDFTDETQVNSWYNKTGLVVSGWRLKSGIVKASQAGTIEGDNVYTYLNSKAIRSALESSKKVEIDNIIYSDDIGVVNLTENKNIKFSGELYFVEDAISSYFPYAIDIQTSKSLFVSGDGFVDWGQYAETSAPIRRRLFNVDSSKKVKLKDVNSRSARFLLNAPQIRVDNLTIETEAGTTHTTDATGFLSVGGFTKGATVKNSTIIGAVSAYGYDIVKAIGFESTGLKFTDNFIKGTGAWQADMDIYDGGRDADISGNAFEDVCLHVKSFASTPGNADCRRNGVHSNSFKTTTNALKFFIYARGGAQNISDNYFTATYNNTNLDYIIYIDQEAASSEAIAAQGDLIISRNTVDVRNITKDVNTFSFVFSDTIAGTNVEELNCIFDSNIVRGMTGLARGQVFAGSDCTNCTIDMDGKTNYSSGSFTFKSIDRLKLQGINYIVTNSRNVTNSPSVAMMDYYNSSIIDVSGGFNVGVLDTENRDVVVLTALNVNGCTRINAFLNITIRPFTIINTSGSDIIVNINGTGGGDVNVQNNKFIQVIPYNDLNFTESRVRFRYILQV